MKLLLLILSIVLISSRAHSQDPLDSLSNITKSPKASFAKANAFLEMSEILYPQNSDTLIYFAEKCINTLNGLSNQRTSFEYKRIKSDAYNNLGYAYYVQGKPKRAETYYKKALKIKESIKDKDGINSVNNNLALVYGDQGNLVTALDIYFELLKIAQDDNDRLSEAKALTNIGYTYHLQKDYSNALYYYNEILQIKEARTNEILIGTIFNNIGALYNSQNNADSALYYFNKALDIRKKSEHIDGIATVLTHIARIHIENEDFELAMTLLNESIDICRAGGLLFLEATTLGAIATVKVKKNEIEDARTILRRLKTIWEETESYKTGLQYANVGLLINEKTKNWAAAFDFITLKQELEDKIASEDMIRQSQQRKFNVEYEVRKKDADLQHAKELAKKEKQTAISEEKRTRLIITIVLISIGSVLLIAALILLNRNFRFRNLITEQKLHNKELQRQALELERDKKSRELTGLSLRMTSNTQYIKEIDHIIVNSKNLEKNDIDELLRNLQQKVKINDINQRTWQEFQRQFEGVHSDFVNRLKKDFPRLTQKEIRLCMLLRLNAGSDEIIQLLGISKNTIKSSRYRIHKKLNLPKGSKLYDFIFRY